MAAQPAHSPSLGLTKTPTAENAAVAAIRVQGHPEDVATYVKQLVEQGALHSPEFAYRDRNGVTIRRYLTAHVRKGRA